VGLRSDAHARRAGLFARRDHRLRIHPMAATNVEAIYGLSPLQEGMLFHSRQADGADPYVVQLVFSVRGELDVESWRGAWQTLVDRQGTLRTGFTWQRGGGPLQIVRTQATLPWTEHDWRTLGNAERAARFERFTAVDRATRFDLTRAPLTRVALLRV